MFRTVRKFLAFGNHNFFGAAQVFVDSELQVQFTIIWHDLAPTNFQRASRMRLQAPGLLLEHPIFNNLTDFWHGRLAASRLRDERVAVHYLFFGEISPLDFREAGE